MNSGKKQSLSDHVNFNIRIFKNKYDNKGEEKKFDSFLESINYLDTPFKTTKPRIPQLFNSKDTAKAVIFGTTNTYGRCNDKGEILTRTALAIDIDEIEFDEDIKSYEQIVAKLTEKLDHNFYIYTTSGSSLASPKFRVIVPLSYPIPASEYPKIIKNYIGIHIDNLKFKIDVSCYEASRIMFVPFIPSNEYIAFSCNETDRKSINPSCPFSKNA